MLSPYTVTIYTKQDNPYNVIPDAPIEIRERLSNGTSGSLSIIYSDQEGLIPITQTGAKADSNGQFVFYAEAAQYNAVYESQTVPVDVGLTVDTLPSTMINNPSLPYVFDTFADMIGTFPIGKTLKTNRHNTTSNKGGAKYTVTSGVSPNPLSSPDLGGGLYAKLNVGVVFDAYQFGAIDNQDSTAALNDAISLMGEYTVLNLGGSFIGEAVTVDKPNITIVGGKVSAPLSATESCFVVTGDDVEFQNVDTFVDWSNLTAVGIVNVGGIAAISVSGLRVVGGNILGARSDSYNPANGTIDEVRSALNLYRCTDAYLAPSKVGECGFVDALGMWESFKCTIEGGLYENGKYSGIASATDLGTAPIGDYGHHTVKTPTVRGMGTSSITMNDPYAIVIAPDVDGGLNGVNFGHSAGQVGQTGITAPNSQLIGGVIRNTTAHGVAIGESKNVKILGATIEDVAGSGVRYFDDCDGGYVGAGTTIKRCGETFVGYSVGAVSGTYTIDGVDADFCASHGVYAIGGTSYIIRNLNIKDVDNANANRNLIQWDSASITPESLEVSRVTYTHDLSASPANRGVSVSNSVAGLVVDVHDCDFKDVAFEKFLFSGVAPTSPSIYKNRLSTDPLTSFVTFAAASTTQTVTNGNLTAYSVPKIIYRDKDCHTRSIYVTSPINGSFTINGDTGADADFSYEM